MRTALRDMPLSMLLALASPSSLLHHSVIGDDEETR